MDVLNLKIDVEVEPDLCKELTKPDDDSQCIPSEKGCKKDKVKCSQKSLYIYDKIICEKLDISLKAINVYQMEKNASKLIHVIQ